MTAPRSLTALAEQVIREGLSQQQERNTERNGCCDIPLPEKESAQHPYPCLDCGSTTGPAVLFCGPCWVERREKGRRK